MFHRTIRCWPQRTTAPKQKCDTASSAASEQQLMGGLPRSWRLTASTTLLVPPVVDFAANFNRRLYPFNAFRSLLGIAGEVKAPTYAELYSGDWEHPTCSSCMG